MIPSPNWSRRFDKPVELPDGSKIETLREAIRWLIDRTPRSEHGTPAIANVAQAIKDAAESNGSMDLVRSEIKRVANRSNLLSIGQPKEEHAHVRAKRRHTRVAHLDFSRFLDDQRLLWRSRQQAAARLKNKEPSRTDPVVGELLAKLRDAEGTIYWKSAHEPTLEGLDIALRLGLVVRLSGPSYEGLTLTRTGRTAVGIGGPLSATNWVALKISHLQQSRYTIASVYQLARDALVVDSLPPLKNVLSAITDPYVGLVSRLLRRRFRKPCESRLGAIGTAAPDQQRIQQENTTF